MSAARDAVLARVRRALADAPAPPAVPRAYRQAGDVPADVERFAERVADYRATVHRTGADGLGAVVRGLLDGLRVVLPPDPPVDLPGVEDVHEADAVLTGCALAIAETGTIVLDGGPACGPRAISLVPDHHVCVVRADQVVAGVPDAVAAMPPTAPLTLISGPSATSDIELERVEGVHGPRRLDVVIVD
jgi:L-lactate dehydrogenase complex protein LldG